MYVWLMTNPGVRLYVQTEPLRVKLRAVHCTAPDGI